MVDSPAHLLSLKVMRVSVCVCSSPISSYSFSLSAARGSCCLATFLFLFSPFLCSCLCFNTFPSRKLSPPRSPKDPSRSYTCLRPPHSPFLLRFNSTGPNILQLPLRKQRSSLLCRFHPYSRRNPDRNLKNTSLPHP